VRGGHAAAPVHLQLHRDVTHPREHAVAEELLVGDPGRAFDDHGRELRVDGRDVEESARFVLELEPERGRFEIVA
jgi:hypothetical protein